MRGAALRLAKMNNVDVSSIRGRPDMVVDIYMGYIYIYNII